jgi:hypothetical protein
MVLTIASLDSRAVVAVPSTNLRAIGIGSLYRNSTVQSSEQHAVRKLRGSP